MYIDDLIEGILRLMEVDYQLPVNLGNQQEYKIIDLVDIFSEIVGEKLSVKFMPILKDDPKRRNPDITTAKKYLKWEPVTDIRQGITKTLAFFNYEKIDL